jgi:hypothetical protein
LIQARGGCRGTQQFADSRKPRDANILTTNETFRILSVHDPILFFFRGFPTKFSRLFLRFLIVLRASFIPIVIPKTIIPIKVSLLLLNS